MRKLSALKIAVEEQESPIMRQVFAWLFPFGPAANSILGTFYISSYVLQLETRFVTIELTWLGCCGGTRIPNFILAFIPAHINGDTLNTMTAFAVSDHPSFDLVG